MNFNIQYTQPGSNERMFVTNPQGPVNWTSQQAAVNWANTYMVGPNPTKAYGQEHIFVGFVNQTPPFVGVFVDVQQVQ